MCHLTSRSWPLINGMNNLIYVFMTSMIFLCNLNFWLLTSKLSPSVSDLWFMTSIIWPQEVEFWLMSSVNWSLIDVVKWFDLKKLTSDLCPLMKYFVTSRSRRLISISYNWPLIDVLKVTWPQKVYIWFMTSMIWYLKYFLISD